MKPRCSTPTNRAFNAFEILIIVAVLFLLMAILLPLTAHVHHTRTGVLCVENLKQASLAFRIWEGDNGNLYPTAVSVTNGGAMEPLAAGDIASCFVAMSNELATPVILHCPQDATHAALHRFGIGFDRSHVSYFVNVDVTNDGDPQNILIGDDDFIAGSLPVKSGLVELSTNTAIAWSETRHDYGGNLGFADGSVREVMTAALPRTFVETRAATNHFAIP